MASGVNKKKPMVKERIRTRKMKEKHTMDAVWENVEERYTAERNSVKETWALSIRWTQQGELVCGKPMEKGEIQGERKR